ASSLRSLSTSQLLEDGSFELAEDPDAESQDQQAHDSADDDRPGVPLVGEERHPIEREDARQRVEGTERLEHPGQIRDVVDDRRGVEQRAQDETRGALKVRVKRAQRSDQQSQSHEKYGLKQNRHRQPEDA